MRVCVCLCKSVCVCMSEERERERKKGNQVVGGRKKRGEGCRVKPFFLSGAGHTGHVTLVLARQEISWLAGWFLFLRGFHYQNQSLEGAL